ncbi:DUF4258 domain-containing protein [Candidatus Roizmanbacteria bacterium]|nr:DUF4258 domain-containing protein [Candidatus Roizmanbacteria bacterium]
MPIVFSDHASYQIRKRRISKKLVRKAVQSPEEILPSFRERKLRRMRIGGKILEVVTKTEGSKITVVTAYYLEE